MKNDSLKPILQEAPDQAALRLIWGSPIPEGDALGYDVTSGSADRRGESNLLKLCEKYTAHPFVALATVPFSAR